MTHPLQRDNSTNADGVDDGMADQSATTADDGDVEILIVDDRQQDLEAMQEVLSQPGYKVTTAKSGHDALWLLLDRDFAVILLDVVMPNLDGFALATIIKERARSRHTPLIFLTAAGLDITRLYRAYSVGAIDYLMKPVDARVVRAKVAVFAELHRKDRRLRRQAEQLRQMERRARELEIEKLKLSSERRYRNLAEAIPQIVWTADERGMLNYCNRRWTEFTGLDLEASRGLGWTKAIHRDDVRRCERTWKAHVRRGELCEFRCRLRAAQTGSYRWHVCRFVPELEEGGRIVAWLGTYTDFEDLLQAIRARDEFLSIASHELRTPLTALKLRLQSLEHGASLDDKARFKVQSAEHQLLRIERLIGSLLDVARIATGQLDLQLEQFSAGACIAEIVERFQKTVSDEQQFIVNGNPTDDDGCWDKLRLEQALTNLLDNAVRYGDGKPVEVTLDADDDRVTIAVTDRGLGIEREDLERIFDRFERLGQRRVPGGLGMGLYIARQIVDAHGGGISARSQVGSGSTFTFWLPRRPPTAIPHPSATP